MLRIEIVIPRPKVLVAWIVGIALFLVWLHWLQSAAPAVTVHPEEYEEDVRGEAAEAEGGNARLGASERRSAAAKVAELRGLAALLSRKADILRFQLELIERERREPGSAAALEWQRRRDELVALLHDERATERRLTEALRDLQEAEDAARNVSRVRTGGGPVEFSWPVEPRLGISAYFHDAGYLSRFGLVHNAVDIPVEQSTVLYAAADGVVKRVSDKGMGYSSLVVAHRGGYATLYGHVSEFLVRAGEEVRRGDPIARSGGAPGTPGAGLLTTGSHLHFEVFFDGEHVDPLTVLPRWVSPV